jgi:hypothetical protein
MGIINEHSEPVSLEDTVEQVEESVTDTVSEDTEQKEGE